MEPTLVVMAAGMGSRFGGLKQAEPVTDAGHTILDFSVYDAMRAGFSRVVFILREDMEEDFRRLVGDRLSSKVHCDYVLQDMSVLPEGRKKPFGTGHAILCCKDTVKGPFAVINADDYYGRNAFFEMYRHLAKAQKGEYAMTAYRLANTLSENGTVSRGEAEIKDGYLVRVTERTKIGTDGSYTDESGRHLLSPDTPVSMNLWGLTPDIFDVLEEEYQTFLTTANLMKDEFYITTPITAALNSGRATVKVYENKDQWYGITYREDLPSLKKALEQYRKEGYYDGI